MLLLSVTAFSHTMFDTLRWKRERRFPPSAHKKITVLYGFPRCALAIVIAGAQKNEPRLDKRGVEKKNSQICAYSVLQTTLCRRLHNR